MTLIDDMLDVLEELAKLEELLLEEFVGDEGLDDDGDDMFVIFGYNKYFSGTLITVVIYVYGSLFINVQRFVKSSLIGFYNQRNTCSIC